MTDNKRRMTLLTSMGALIISGLMGLTGWLATGSESGRMLVLVSLVLFALAYYALETQVNGHG